MTQGSRGALTELTCKEIEQLVLDYVEGNLDESSRLQFEDHLRDCQHCTIYLEAYRVTVTLAKRTADPGGTSTSEPVVPKGLVAAIMSALRPGSD